MTNTPHPALLDRRILPLAELLALCLDGQLYAVGDSFATPDTPDTPSLRAHALAASVPRRAIAERGTAAWIHGTRSDPPPRPQICLVPQHRGTHVPARVESRQRSLHPAALSTIGPLTVTTPLRTAADLLLSSPAFDDAAALEVQHLLSLADEPATALCPFFPRTPRGGAARAAQRLDAVTRASLPSAEAMGRNSDVSRR